MTIRREQSTFGTARVALRRRISAMGGGASLQVVEGCPVAGLAEFPQALVCPQPTDGGAGGVVEAGEGLSGMTITAFAGELAGQIRTQPVFDTPQVRLGLQLAVAVWLDGAWDGSAAMRWGLFGTAVQEVLVAMFPSPPEQLVQLDPQGLSDDRLAGAAVADLVTAIADLLDTTTTTDGGGATALHRRWAQQLRDAVADLQ